MVADHDDGSLRRCRSVGKRRGSLSGGKVEPAGHAAGSHASARHRDGDRATAAGHACAHFHAADQVSDMSRAGFLLADFALAHHLVGATGT